MRAEALFQALTVSCLFVLAGCLSVQSSDEFEDQLTVSSLVSEPISESEPIPEEPEAPLAEIPPEFSASEDPLTNTLHVTILDSSQTSVNYEHTFSEKNKQTKFTLLFYDSNGEKVTQCSYNNVKIPEDLTSYIFPCKLPETDPANEWKDKQWKESKKLRIKFGIPRGVQ